MSKKQVFAIIFAVLVVGGFTAYKINQVFHKAEIDDTGIQVDLAKSWKVYKNFGIEFQYPAEWGIPQESISGDAKQVHFGSEGASVSIESSFRDAAGNVETFDQMIQSYAKSKNLNSMKDVVANGVRGKEVLTNSAVNGKLYFFNAFFPMGGRSFVDFFGNIPSLSKETFEKVIGTFKYDPDTAVKIDPATDLLVYKNNGIGFEYPANFNTNYASLTVQTKVEKVDSSKADSNGCYSTANEWGNPGKTSVTTINGMRFCYTMGGDVGAGQLYRTYRYATSHGENVYTIDYVVHTSNGCGVYKNEDDVNAPENEKYKACMSFLGKDYENLVLKPIQNSIATFKFITE